VRRLFESLASESTGTSSFVARAVLLDTPPSIDAHELTDKGSLNQRAVLESRRSWVERLYATAPDAAVIVIRDPREASHVR
jgi:feruloyl-CoA synthase